MSSHSLYRRTVAPSDVRANYSNGSRGYKMFASFWKVWLSQKKRTIFHPLICSSYANCWGVSMLCVPFAGDRVCTCELRLPPVLYDPSELCVLIGVCLSDSFSFLYFFFVILFRAWWSHSSHNRSWKMTYVTLFYGANECYFFMCVWRVEVLCLFFI